MLSAPSSPPHSVHGTSLDEVAPWHALSVEDCLARLDTPRGGLHPAAVEERRRRWGLNELPRPRTPSWAELLLRQFRSPLIYLLVAATALSLWMGERLDAGFIALVLLLNALIGAVQEGRAGASSEALQRLVRHTARVERDGSILELDAAQLVPGDLVHLESGSGVPADLRIVSAAQIRVDESLLTGEALPAEKHAAAVSPGAPLGDRTSILHAGTTVLSGRAIGVVVATGSNTELGRIDASLRAAPPAPPPLMLYLERLSRQIAIATVSVIAILALAMLARDTAPGEIFLLAVALAVSAIPEGLPIAVTVALAVATRRMAARNVIVRSLPAVEGLGACTLVATDKTGTLTQNRLSVEAVLAPDGRTLRSTDLAAENAIPREVARAAAACNEASWTAGGEPTGDSVDVALLRFAAEVGDVEESTRLALFAYEPANRFASVAVRAGDRIQVYAKGAVETILAMCDRSNDLAASAAGRLACEGYRVLALAGARVDQLDAIDLAAPKGLELIGCVALIDPLRPEAADAVRQCANAGIDVRMVTGDHPQTALTIARQLGLARDGDHALTGSRIAELSGDPEALGREIRSARVFARTEPQQKHMIVEVLRASGHIVAVTGDGVNDAPALHAADLGVAMGAAGTDVARGAADLILVDDNFASIVAGVEEGRVTFTNIRRIAIFLLATGMAEIGMFLVAIAAGLPLPLAAVQLLWCNLVTEGAQTVTLAFGRGQGGELDQKPRRVGARLIDRSALVLMFVPALLMAVFAAMLLAWELARGESVDSARSSVLLATVLFQNAFVLSTRNEATPVWRHFLRGDRWLLVGIVCALALQVAAMTLPPLQAILGTRLPDSATMIVCIGSAGLTLAASELAKGFVLWIRRGRAERALAYP